MPSSDCYDNVESTGLHHSHGDVLLYTCPESQAQHCLVHGVFEAEVWNDLEVVGGMESIGCNGVNKKNMNGSISVSVKIVRTCSKVKQMPLNTPAICLEFSYM